MLIDIMEGIVLDVKGCQFDSVVVSIKKDRLKIIRNEYLGMLSHRRKTS